MSSDYWSRFWQDHGEKSLDADPHVQVLRTSHGRPVSPEAFCLLLEELERLLDVSSESRVVDLCCGNGLLSVELARDARSVLGVDLSPGLIAAAESRRPANVSFSVADIRQLDLPTGSFDRALLYAGLQYFSEEEAVALLCRIRSWLSDDGILLVGDIPDVRRRWNFFDNEERRRAYFESLVSGEPLIGTWFERDWIDYAGSFAGFSRVEVLDQADGLPYSHFRFDALFRI